MEKPSCHTVYLSRRNLLTLLNKLDMRQEGQSTAGALIKYDNVHPVYPQTMDMIIVAAVEDEDYYIDRKPGEVNTSATGVYKITPTKQ